MRPPCQSSIRFSGWALQLSLLAAALAVVGCGKDAERRYAGLTTRRVELDQGGYLLRYLSPPWERAKTDPLDTGSRKSVPIGGMSTPIVPDSGSVLEIAREASTEDVEALNFPKYRLEAALVPCASEDTQELSCAEYLAGLDYAARQSKGEFDLFGAEPRHASNDADQDYYELMGQSETTRRYVRVVFFAAEPADALAAWLLIEGSPDLSEREITELVQAFELLPAPEGEAEP